MKTAANASLAELTTLCLGGRADTLLTLASEDELVGAVADADARGQACLVLGGGSNVVVGDDGFRGVVALVATRGVAVAREAGRVLVTAAAGESWDGLVDRCVGEGWSGLEALSGIPGTVGATPIQNVGAYGAEVARVITGVRVFDRLRKTMVELDPAACGFGYRDSIFKREGRHLVVSVTFALEPRVLSGPLDYGELCRALGVTVGSGAPLTRVREAVLELRRGKGMVVDPADPESRSVGSFFTNPVVSDTQLVELEQRVRREPGDHVMPPRFPALGGGWKVPAAWLIERAGVKRGLTHGGVGVSTKHALALVNRGGGTTSELLALGRFIRDRVEARFGVRLIPEPVFVGTTW